MGNELKTIVSADTSKFVNEFQSIGSAAKRVTADMKKFRETTDGTFAIAEKEEIAFARSLGQLTTQSSNAKGQFKELKSAVENLTISYRMLTDEERNSPFGQAISQSIEELTERAGNAKDAISDINTAINNASSDTRTFDQIAGGMNTLMSTVQVGTGIMNAFGVKNQSVIEAMSRLQGIMAVTNGIQTIQNNLQRQSATMQGIMAIQLRARAAAEAMATNGTRAATVAQTVFNAVANANPYVLLATAIISVGAALVTFATNTNDASKETKTLDDRVRDLTYSQQELLAKIQSANKVATEAKDIRVKWKEEEELLRARIDDARTSIDKQKRLVDDYNSKWGQRMGYVKNYAELCKKSHKEIAENFAKYSKAEVKQAEQAEYFKLAAQARGAAAKLEFKKKEAEMTLNAERARRRKELEEQIKSTQTSYDIAIGADDSRGAAVASNMLRSLKEELSKIQGDVVLTTGSNIVQQMNQLRQLANFYEDKGNSMMREVATLINDLPKYSNTSTSRKSGGSNKPSGSNKPGGSNTEETAVVGSLTYYTDLLNKEQKKLDSQLVKGTDEYTKQLRIVEDLKQKVKELKENELQEVSTTQVATASEFRNPRIHLESGVDLRGILDDVSFFDDIDAKYDELIQSQKEWGIEASQMTFDGVVSSAQSLAQVIGGLNGQWISFAATTAASIAQMIAQNAQLLASAQAVAMANGAKSAFALPFPANLAAWATLSATLLGIWASLPKFASGGIVGGSSYYGDRLTARVNSGEMILNKRQQSNLFSMINSGNALGGGKVEFEIRADRLIGVQKNYNRKQSKF